MADGQANSEWVSNRRKRRVCAEVQHPLPAKITVDSRAGGAKVTQMNPDERLTQADQRSGSVSGCCENEGF